MKILMISDLHINDDSSDYLKEVYHRINRMADIINGEVLPTELLVVVMCGDVVDCGKKKYYASAKMVFEYLKQKLEISLKKFVMVPGNHDLCDSTFEYFDKFCKLYCDNLGEFERANCLTSRIGDINFILANSSYHKDWNYGKVDMDMIEQSAIPGLNNILVTHHSTVSEDDNDTAAIRNVPRLTRIIDDNDIVYHFHGHTHGTYITNIGEKCKSLGVGAMLLKAQEMNSQFHLISLHNNKITSIVNYLYRIDRDKYIAETIYKDEDDASEVIEYDSKTFELPDNYIPRLIGPYDVVQGGQISMYYNREQLKSLFDIISENERVVLIGDAGTGKSYELQNLAYEIELKNYAEPVYIQLNDYVDETIEELISINKKSNTNGKKVLIFDGYDEIEESNLTKFARRINSFVKKNPYQKLIISTRSNFYKNASDDTKNGTFYDFYECSLCPLKADDIYTYLQRNNIEKSLFMAEVNGRNLNDLIEIPFFLAKITELFHNESNLPEANSIMKDLIFSSFEKDVTKYINTKNVEEQKNEIIDNLKILAFSMQCLRRNSLTIEEYQKMIDMNDRVAIKYCGVWKKNKGDKWEFEHNNFREYLVAEYLRNLTLDQIIELVTYKDGEKHIKESWVNVLSFLVIIYHDNTLLDWIIDTDCSIAVKFETSRISVSQRTMIFCKIMEEHKKANLWISRQRNDECELAKFGQSKESIEYLLKEIEKPVHFRAQSNAIHILGKMTNYFGKEDEVREALFLCCFSENTRKYEVSASIIALMNEALYSDSDSERLISFFENEDDTDILYALYCYILEHQLQDRWIDFVIKGIEKIHKRGIENFSELSRLEEILQSLKQYESIVKVIENFLKMKDAYFHTNYFEKVINELCKKAQDFYNNGRSEIIRIIQNLYYKSAIEFERYFMKVSKNMLENTQQIFSTYKWILNMNTNDEENKIFALEYIMNEQCIDDFAEQYKNNELENKQIFISYVRRCRSGSYNYNYLRELILKNDNVEIEPREEIDYNALREKGERKYIDSLFEKQKFQQLLNDLADCCKGKNTEYKDLEHVSFKVTEKRYDLDKVKWAIMNYNFPKKKIIDFISQIEWEDFSIGRMYDELKSDNTVILNSEQKEYIKQYCLKTVKKIDFTKEVRYKKDGSTTFSWRCAWCAFFAQYFSIEFEEKIVLEMLVLPTYLFGEKNQNHIFSTYIMKRLDNSTIKKQVCYNLNNISVEGNLAECYIKYCKENHLEEAFKLANEIILDSEYREWIRREALEYILVIRNSDFVIENYLENSDEKLLEILVEKLCVYQDDRVIEKMIGINKESQDGCAFLKMLILSEAEYGLEKYYNLAKENNSIPDLNAGNNIAEVTEAIGEISNIKNLELIIKMAMLTTQEDFRDKKFFGLYNSTYKAIKNISQNNPEKVIEQLDKAEKENQGNLEFIGFCNQLKQDIQLELFNQKDLPWTIDEIKKYVEQGNN